MIDSIINCGKKTEKAESILVSVPYDETASYGKGTSRGPKEIIDCLDLNLEFFDRFTRNEPAYLFKTASYEVKDLEGIHPEKMVNKVAESYQKLNPQKNKFMIMLGGEHTVSIGAFKYFSDNFKVEDITVVQIDAHLDLREDDSDYNDENPTNFAHSCVMRKAIEYGFKTVHAGIRTYAKPEIEFAEKNKLKIFEWGRGKRATVEEIVGAITTSKIYLTVDVDGLDPSCTPATGTPVPGGMKWDFFVELLQELFRKKEFVGADVVEVSPREGDKLTEYTAAQICYYLLSWQFHKKNNKLLF